MPPSEEDREVWKDIGKVEGTLESFRNQIRDLWKKADEREEVDTRQDAKILEIEGLLSAISGSVSHSKEVEESQRPRLQRGDYPKVALALLFVVGGFGSAIGWWTWVEFKEWIVDAWQTLGQMIGFGGGGQ
jgi:hypothetical protein